IIAILLGLVAMVTAWASFQSSLWDGNMTQNYTNGSNLATEAESLYLEGNQQYVQDAQLIITLRELQLQAEAGDPVAQAQFETIYFESVSEDLDAAIQRADAENAANPDFSVSPLDDEEYQGALFGAYAETSDEADATIAEGDVANTQADKLTLNTVLLALSLFLLGIAAIVKRNLIKYVLTGFAVVIAVVATVLTAAIPALWIG
ncbi:MAG TPA: hypothetical protein VN200_05975, partial [Rhodoglobus sp.]|nr:hypothetical protein [Rhodoglobus sp.]